VRLEPVERFPECALPLDGVRLSVALIGHSLLSKHWGPLQTSACINWDQQTSEAIGLSAKKSKQLTQFEQTRAGDIAVNKQVSRIGLFVRMISLVDHIVAKPKRNRAAMDKRFVFFLQLAIS
jgi:hypothetical protein